MFQRSLVALLMLIGPAIPYSVAEARPSPAADPGNPDQAVFEDTEIDLGQSWEDANACIEFDDHTECFRTEDEMFAAHPEYADTGGGVQSFGAAAAMSGGFTTQATCSSSLRLYRSTGFTGGTLVITTRAVVLNLSNYGFDNDTSSYQVGACAATFWAGSSGSGSIYPGATGAGASASSMLSGWNNVVSSIYLH